MTKVKDKKKLRAILAQIDPGEVESVAVKNFEEDLSYMIKKIDALRDSASAISDLQNRFALFESTILEKISTLTPRSSLDEIKNRELGLKSTISLVEDHIDEVDSSLHKEFNSFSSEIKKILKEFQDSSSLTKKDIDEIRLQSLGNRGGSMPLQVSVSGTVANVRYADINILGATAVSNNTTKKTDITTTGGTGGGGFTYTNEFIGTGDGDGMGDGTNSFNLANNPTNPSGIFLMSKGGFNQSTMYVQNVDYTVSGLIITFTEPPLLGLKIYASYA